MSLVFQTVRITFPSVTGQTQHVKGTATFKTNVKAADASLKGFFAKYTKSDHNLWQVELSVNQVSIAGTAVSFNVDYLLRDSSGNIDDPYDGWVDVLVTADA